MEVLTGDTFAEALLFCSQQENVSVCVVLDNMRNTKELVKTLWREIELGNLPGWVMQRGFDVASFSNTYSILNTKKSSVLYFITAYDTQEFKGRTFNRILYLSDLNAVILSEIERCEQPLVYRWNIWWRGTGQLPQRFQNQTCCFGSEGDIKYRFYKCMGGAKLVRQTCLQLLRQGARPL